MSLNEKKYTTTEYRLQQGAMRELLLQAQRERDIAIAQRLARDIGSMASPMAPLNIPSAYAAEHAINEMKFVEQVFQQSRKKRGEHDPQVADQLQRLAAAKPDVLAAVREDKQVKDARESFSRANSAFRDFMEPRAESIRDSRKPEERHKPIRFDEFKMSPADLRTFRQLLGEVQKTEHDLINNVQKTGLREGIQDERTRIAIGIEMIERDTFHYDWRRSQKKAIEERERDNREEQKGPRPIEVPDGLPFQPNGIVRRGSVR